MRNTLNNRKALWVFLATLSGLMMFSNSDAADFLFFWKASTDPSVIAYGIYQRVDDSSYEAIGEVRMEDLDDPSHPSYLVTGLSDGVTYWFAVTSVSASGSESSLSNQTCITVNDQIIECTDQDEDGATLIISCFINTLSEWYDKAWRLSKNDVGSKSREPNNGFIRDRPF